MNKLKQRQKYRNHVIEKTYSGYAVMTAEGKHIEIVPTYSDAIKKIDELIEFNNFMSALYV